VYEANICSEVTGSILSVGDPGMSFKLRPPKLKAITNFIGGG
jgi:hypothetical protein